MLLQSTEKNGMKRLDDKLASLENKIGGVFKLMVNLQEADVPAFCFVTPATTFEDGDGFFGFATNFRRLIHFSFRRGGDGGNTSGAFGSTLLQITSHSRVPDVGSV